MQCHCGGGGDETGPKPNGKSPRVSNKVYEAIDLMHSIYCTLHAKNEFDKNYDDAKNSEWR